MMSEFGTDPNANLMDSTRTRGMVPSIPCARSFSVLQRRCLSIPFPDLTSLYGL